MEPLSNDESGRGVRDGETPETALVANGHSAPPAIESFDLLMHEAVQKLMSLGLWVVLPPRYGRLKVRLRPFHNPHVVSWRERAERKARRDEGLRLNGEISAEGQIGVTLATVQIAVTDVEGYVNAGTPSIKSDDPKILAAIEETKVALAAAREIGFPVTDGPNGAIYIRLDRCPAGGDREEHAKQIRRVFNPILKTSTLLLMQLLTISQDMQSVKDEEVYALGESYVFGLEEGRDSGA